jgi:secreted trypsin-like serine protease
VVKLYIKEGGPLVTQTTPVYVAGIVSYGLGSKCGSNTNGIYTKVSFFKDFINNPVGR